MKIQTISAIALAVSTLSACGGQTATSTAPTTATNAITTSAAVAAASDTSTPTGSTDGTQAFGSTMKYPDGLSITVGKPQPFTPSTSAAVMDKKSQALVIDITVMNGTNAPFDAAPVYITGQSGDAEAHPIIDMEKGVSGPPQTKILPGRQAKWKVAFSTPKPLDLVLEVTPGITHDAVMFKM